MGSPKQSDVEALVEILRRDPELETWQLRQRGYPDTAIQAARRAAGVPHPINSMRRHAASVRRKR